MFGPRSCAEPSLPPAINAAGNQQQHQDHNDCKLQRQTKHSPCDKQKGGDHQEDDDSGRDGSHHQIQSVADNTLSCLLPRGLLLPVTRAHGCFDVSAHIKVALNLYAQRIAGVHKIFENDIHYVLVKNLHVAERIDVKLQTLQFDAAFVRHVREANRGKVRKVRVGADAGELGNLKIDSDFAAGK